MKCRVSKNTHNENEKKTNVFWYNFSFSGLVQVDVWSRHLFIVLFLTRILFWMTDEAIATGLRNGHGHHNSFTVNNFSTNGQCYESFFNGVETIPAEPRIDMCGSLHLSGSPSSCVSHRPAWDAFSPDSSEHLHYGHYHGFGDTAEDLEDASICHEHSTTVKVERLYDQEVLSAVQLFHGC